MKKIIVSLLLAGLGASAHAGCGFNDQAKIYHSIEEAETGMRDRLRLAVACEQAETKNPAPELRGCFGGLKQSSYPALSSYVHMVLEYGSRRWAVVAGTMGDGNYAVKEIKDSDIDHKAQTFCLAGALPERF